MPSKPPSFPVWLRAQRDRDDAVGLLAVETLSGLDSGVLLRLPTSPGVLLCAVKRAPGHTLGFVRAAEAAGAEYAALVEATP